MWSTVDRGFEVMGSEAFRGGPAAGAEADPHVLTLASPRPDLVRGLFAAVLMGLDVIEVRHGLQPSGGLLRGLVRFASRDGAGKLAAHLKRRYRTLLNPVVRDEAFDRTSRDPLAARFPLPLEATLPKLRFRGAYDQEWAAGVAWQPGRVGSQRKLCLATTDRVRLEQVVAAVLMHPRSVGAKSNLDEVSAASVFARLVFLDDASTGAMGHQLAQQVPELNPVVQDDGWFKVFRHR